jgi:hypothetical protein
MSKRCLNIAFMQDMQNKGNTTIGMKLHNALNLVTFDFSELFITTASGHTKETLHVSGKLHIM